MVPPQWESSAATVCPPGGGGSGMTCAVFSRAITLFAIGAVLRMALDLLQVESETPTSWLVPVSGCAAVCIGIIYPYLTTDLTDAPDGAMVIRCVAVFVGIYQAGTKIYFSSYIELFVTLVALAVGMWWLFDRSQSGFVFSVITALVLSSLTHFMYILRIFNVNDFLYPRVWSLYFSACVLFGTIGRWVYHLEHT